MTRTTGPGETLGTRQLRAEIARRDITQAQAAAEIGASGAALSDWLAGKKSPDEVSRVRMRKWSGGRVKVTAWDVGRETLRERKRIAPAGKPRRAKR